MKWRPWFGFGWLVILTTAVAAQNEQENLPAANPKLRDREARYYEIVDIPVPLESVIEVGSFDLLPDGRLAIGTRRGDVFFVNGAFAEDPTDAEFERFASGLHEVFGLSWRDGAMTATQQCEVTIISDLDGDGVADRYATLSDGWGYGGEHEFTWGSRHDPDGNVWVVCCLTGSYTSENRFRGWALRIAPDGTTTPVCSGIRSPGGIGWIDGTMFYTESQGPWNGACSLKPLRPGGFMGHPISFPWYEDAPQLTKPKQPTGGEEGRLHLDRERIPELVPPAVVFPYRKTCQSASGFAIDDTGGKFGPFTGQLFVADYTLSLVMRVDLEVVNGVHQGAVFPFRQGFDTGLLAVMFSPEGQLLAGGTSRGWPVRGREPSALQRLQWTGQTPFEVKTMRVEKNGFRLTFTQPVDRATAEDPASYTMKTYTHHYWKFYGSQEIDNAAQKIVGARVTEDGLTVHLVVDELVPGHIHELQLDGVKNEDGAPLLHPVGYYTLNELPRGDR